MPEVLVEARSAARTYPLGGAEIAAVTDVSCTIAAYDRIALVGPSGSGKSTLLFLLAQFEAPSAGEIDWPSIGRGEQPVPTHAGFAFQTPNLLAQLTAMENVALPLLIAGAPREKAENAARAMLERFDLLDVAHRYSEDLSGGQAERVGLARALVADPTLVFADEPTGQLDGPTAARAIDALLAAADASGAAILLATHDERIARRFPTRWTMRHGALHIG
jgi:ABC-type lipoprotein export system ATPase subunit